MEFVARKKRSEGIRHRVKGLGLRNKFEVGSWRKKMRSKELGIQLAVCLGAYSTYI
jgi:hypothetical protein